MSTIDKNQVGDYSQARLGRLLRQYRQPNNTRNILHLGCDLLTIVAVIALSVWLCEHRGANSFTSFLAFPVVGVAIVLIGAAQHRLAGLGHEGSHHVLFKNRWLNELIADWFCMFPVFTTTDHYRSLHLGHHRWVNDLELDPEFHNLGRARRLHTFPMSRSQFLLHFVSRILWPVSLLRYSWDNMLHGSIGVTQRGASDWPVLRPMVFAGVAHFLTATFGLRLIGEKTQSSGWVLLAMVIWILVAAIAIWPIRSDEFYHSGYPGTYGPKLRSWMRLTFFTILQGSLVLATLATAVDYVWYFRLLWLLPMVTSFPYFMLLRDAYQHANTDEGRYSNSRVMFPDPFSGWAIFMYGSDIHLTHHMYPGVPHYKLRRLHDALKRRSKQYSDEVVETHGMFRRTRPDLPCLIETIEGAA